MSIPNTLSLILGTAVLTCATTAQEPVRVALPPATAPETSEPTGTKLPPLRVVEERTSRAPLDDRPDFAPMEEYQSADGHHTYLRPNGNPYVLSFTNGDYVPEPGIDPQLLAKQRADGAGSTFGYVMLEGRMADAKIETLRELGVEVLDFHTWQSVAARIPLSRLQDIARLPFVHWIGQARLPQKLGVRLARAMRLPDDGAPLDLLVTVFSSDLGPDSTRVRIGEQREVDRRAATMPTFHVMPNGPHQKALERLGFKPTFYDEGTFTFAGRATRSLVRKLQELDFVQFLEARVRHTTGHDQSMAMIGQDRVRGTWPGKWVPVGVIDTGIDSTPWHKDLQNKGYLAWKSSSQLPSAYQDGNGHGTHVAGTVFGDGTADKRYTGAAPWVGRSGEGDRIFIGRYLDNTGSSKGFAKSLYDEFKKSHSYNGKSNPKRALVNNSWGGSDKDGFKGSEYESRTVDKIVFDNNQSYIFCAGNKKDTPNWWAWEPACAKNVLTVGNVNDHWSSSTKPGQKNSTSRWGTRDGRLKPEVCAPGGLVTSTWKNTATGYNTIGGTSMSTPTVTGALASLIDRDSGFKYFPAAVKAAAIASATLDGTLNAESQRGYGQINSYKLNKVGKTKYWVFGGTLTKSGNWAAVDIPITANLAAIRATLVMIEPAAAAGATKARRNDLRLYIDIPPYSSSGNSGEYSNSSSVHTVISYKSSGGSLTQAAKGKTVRFKVYANSIKLLDDVKYAVAVIQYYKAPSTSKKPTLQVTPSTTAIRPFNNLTLDTKLITHATADDFSNARVWVNGPGSWKMQTIRRTTADSIVQVYDKSNTHPSADFPNVTTSSSGGMTVGTGDTRRVKFEFQSPSTEGQYDLDVRASYHSGGLTQTVTKIVKVCVDDSPPNKASGLQSSTHSPNVWSNKSQITFKWIPISDNGCAGIDRQYYELSKKTPKDPNIGSQSVAQAQGWAILNATTSHDGYYFSVAAEDKVGLWGPTASIGPFKIDTAKPAVTGLLINGGASSTSSLTVDVKALGFDFHSGVRYVQYSMNNAVWSPWFVYTGNTTQLSLASYGGNSNYGNKPVYARVKDRAGNVSPIKSAVIYYGKGAVLSQATIATLPSVNANYYRLVGTDLNLVKSIEFAGRTITTKWSSAHNSSWVNGYFRIFGSTVIWFYPPQALAPGDYTVRVKTVAVTSNGLTLKVTPNTTNILRSASTMIENGLQTLMVTRGKLSPSVTTIIMASTSDKPSVLPGFYNFGIGNGFTEFILLPEIPFDRNGIARLSFPVLPVMVGLKAYFQAGYIDKKSPTWPMPVSDVWSTSYVK